MCVCVCVRERNIQVIVLEEEWSEKPYQLLKVLCSCPFTPQRWNGLWLPDGIGGGGAFGSALLENRALLLLLESCALLLCLLAPLWTTRGA